MIRKLFNSVLCLAAISLLYSCHDRDLSLPQDDLWEECLVPVSRTTFDIMTWNVKDFPLQGDRTIRMMADIIQREDADLIALQEITGENALNNLTDLLPGWNSETIINGDLNLAFIYKVAEVSLKGQSSTLFNDEPYYFPRPPLLIAATHGSGLSVFLLNVHFKCCGGAANESRRRNAGLLLKEYIDKKLPNEKLIVLGDFNDEIIPVEYPGNVYFDFIADSLHYRFADLMIATDSSAYWSYPSWPSHIDHILITDELFGHVFSAGTIAPDNCDPGYLSSVSDHRPVLIRLSE